MNLKYIHDDARGKFTAYIDWQNKVEPNEDATAFGNQQTAAAAGFTPYTPAVPLSRPRRLARPRSRAGRARPPVAQGNNFSNCFSAAQRTDILAYVKYDLKVSNDITWSNQAYYHYDYGRGIVAGPINQAGLPALFATYFPNLVVGTPTSAATLAEHRQSVRRQRQRGAHHGVPDQPGRGDLDPGLGTGRPQDRGGRLAGA